MVATLGGVLSLYLLFGGCTPAISQQERSHEVLGVIAEVAADRSAVTISHEDIPGFMKAMVMPFKVSNAQVVEGVQVGDEVRFHLVIRGGAAFIDRITKFAKQEETFPAFKLKTVDGKDFDSQKLKGNVTLINFWATWCPPCKVEIPWFTEFKKKYQDKGFEIVGVTMDPENKDAILGFQKDFKINYPLLLSDGKIEEQAGGIIGVPTTFLVGRNGRVVSKHVGLVSKVRLQKQIEDLF